MREGKDLALTVVIPTHRRHSVLKTALESVFRQKDVPFEVIVINGIEDDKDTDAVVAGFKDAQYIKSKEYLSCSSKRLLGLSMAKGRYLNFLDDDDYLIDDCFYKKAVEILDRNDKLAFVAGNSKVRRELSVGANPVYEEKPLPFKGVVNGLEYFSKLLIEWPKPKSTCPTIFRKSALLGEHPLKEVNDASIYLRALLDGDAYILNDFVAVYRVWPLSISNGGEGNDLRLKMETMIQKERFYYMAETKIPDVKKWWRGTFAMNLRYFLSSLKDDREIILLATWGILHSHGDEGVASQCASALASVCPSLFARIEPICHLPKVFFHLKALLHKRFLDSSSSFEPYYSLVMGELDAAISANRNLLDIGFCHFIRFRNFGDLLSCNLAEQLSGQRLVHRSFTQADFLAVGSLLQSLPKCNDSFRDPRAPLHVWGGGLLNPIPKPEPLPSGRVVVHAVRGANTLKELREMGAVRQDEKVALGDPGLFYADLIPGIRETKKAHDIAIIPHHYDQEEFSRAAEALSECGFSVKLIDVGDSDPLQVVRDIAAARKVLSSSLHGLIVADSLGVPNKRLVIDGFDNDKVRSLAESNFKFEDYYSAFGLSRPGYVTLSELMRAPKKVVASVLECVPKERVEECKRALMASFPFACKTNARANSTLEARTGASLRDNRERPVERPIVSVIIPVYNVEKYLPQCLDSIANQTLRDIEIICVDDGSTDGSLEILAQYAAKFTNFTVLEQRHGGVSAARNRGLARARGEYVYFMDSDDWLDTGALGKLTAIADEQRLDQLIFSAEVFCDAAFAADVGDDFLREKQDYYVIPGDITARPMPGIDLAGSMIAEGAFFVQPSLRLHRREALMRNRHRFPKGIVHEDEYFAMVTLASAGLAMLIDERFFHRRIRPGSIMTSGCTALEHAKGCLTVAKALVAYAKEHYAPTDRAMQMFADRALRLKEFAARYAMPIAAADLPAALKNEILDAYRSIKLENIMVLRDRLDKTIAQSEKRKAHNEALRERLDKVIAQSDKRKADNEALRGRLDTVIAQSEKRKAASESLRERLDKVIAQSDKRKTDNEALRERLDKVIAQSDKRKTDNEALRERLDKVITQSEKRKADNEALRGRLDKMQAQSDRRNVAKEAAFSKQLAKLGEQSEKRKADNEVLRDRLAKAVAQSEKRRSDNETLRERLDKVIAQSDKRRADNEALHEKLAKAVAQSDKRKADNAALREKLGKAVAQSDKRKADNTALREKLTKAVKLADKRKGDIAKLQGQVDKSSKLIAKYQRQVQQYEKIIARVSGAVK